MTATSASPSATKELRLILDLFDWFYDRLPKLPVLNVTPATHRLGVRVLCDPHAKLVRAAALAFELSDRAPALDVAFWAAASALDRLWVGGVRRGPPEETGRKGVSCG